MRLVYYNFCPLSLLLKIFLYFLFLFLSCVIKYASSSKFFSHYSLHFVNFCYFYVKSLPLFSL
ncbi:unnamed protein product [Meloidogyne enterolobii]|uniref:Uncharacterized protein n=1 Tax=Meloidogyne enterolobii TaxID=390850 RepID=A0ACB0ZFM8_MELEN